MIHIVFQAADAPALQKSFELDEKLRGEIILIKDDFAVGPLGDIYSEEAKKQDTSITMAALRNQFGQDNVKYDASTGFFHVKVIKKVIANSADAKNWTFLVIEEAQKPVLEKFVPKELLD